MRAQFTKKTKIMAHLLFKQTIISELFIALSIYVLHSWYMIRIMFLIVAQVLGGLMCFWEARQNPPLLTHILCVIPFNSINLQPLKTLNGLGGEGGIRTHGDPKEPQRFSRPPQ